MQIVKSNFFNQGTPRSLFRFPSSSKRCIICTLLLGAAIGLAGCTPEQITNYAQLIEQQSEDSQAHAVDSAAENRLLVLQADGNIVTMDPAGDDIIRITDDASGTNVYQQPTWSPDGRYIAWTRTISSGGNSQAALQIGDHLGTHQRELQLPFAPFYYYWSPDSERLAYLSNWIYHNMGAMALRIVETSTEKLSSKTLALGQPSYFSWAPDSRQLITHIGNQRTSIRSVDGENQALSEESSGFSAPQWVADGESLLYAVNAGGEQSLILSGLDGNNVQELTT